MNKWYLFIILMFCLVLFGCGSQEKPNEPDPEPVVTPEHVHEYEYFEGVNPTCTTSGYKAYYKCKGCDDTNYEELPKLGHDYIKEVIDASCTENGKIIYTCSRCNDTYTEIIEALGHKYIHHEGLSPTYDSEGYTDYYECERCHDTYGKEIIPKLVKEHVHEYEIIEKVDATNLNTGYYLYKCGVCGDMKKEYINVLNKDVSEIGKINILLVGNSFTNFNTLMKCLENVIKGEGKDATVEKCSYGDQYLHNYIQGGDHYSYLVGMVNSKHYDVAILQEYSTHTFANPGDFYDSSRWLYDYFNNKDTKVMFYATWSDLNGYPNRGMSRLQMTEIIEAHYEAISTELSSYVSSVGAAFYYFNQMHPEVNLFSTDNHHPSSVGTYIASLCHFATIYGTKLSDIKYTYNDYANDASITFHAKTLDLVTDEIQKDIEECCNRAIFGESIVSSANKVSSLNVHRDDDKIEGFNKVIDIDNDVLGSIDATFLETSGTWSVSLDRNRKTSFTNTTDKAVLMFQEELIKDKDSWNIISFDFVLKEELESSTYARGILLGSNTPKLSYFDGNDALILGRRRYNTSIATQAMRVWNPDNYPQYNVSSSYSFDKGLDLIRVEHLVNNLNTYYHIQIVFNLNEQKYGIYVNGKLSAYVIGVDLPTGGYIGLMSYDSNKMTFSNFKLNGYEMNFHKAE